MSSNDMDGKTGSEPEKVKSATEKRTNETSDDILDTSDEGPYGCVGTSPGFLQCFNTIGWFSFFMCMTTCIQVSLQAHHHLQKFYALL